MDSFTPVISLLPDPVLDAGLVLHDGPHLEEEEKADRDDDPEGQAEPEQGGEERPQGEDYLGLPARAVVQIPRP